MDIESATNEELASAASEFYRDLTHRGNTDPESSRGLALCAGALLLRGADLPQPVRRWLGVALLATGSGTAAAIAFRTRRPKGRPPVVDWADVAVRYHAHFREDVAPYTAFCAIAVDLSLALGREIDERTIRNTYDAHIAWFYENFPVELSRQMTGAEVLEILMAYRSLREHFRPFFEGSLPPGLESEPPD